MDSFSARWTASLPFAGGAAKFTTYTDDGVRVFVDGKRIINNWTVHGITMDGVNPTIATISDGSYPGARKMFIYVKKAHIDKIPGIKDFVLEFLKGGVVGGYLTKLGMIASSD